MVKKFISILLLLNFSVALFGGDTEEKSGSGSGCGAGASVSDTADATVGVGAGAGAGEDTSRKRPRSKDSKEESNASRCATDNSDTPTYKANSSLVDDCLPCPKDKKNEVIEVVFVDGKTKKYLVGDLWPFGYFNCLINSLEKNEKINLILLKQEELDAVLDIYKRLIDRRKIELDIDELEKCIKNFEALSADNNSIVFIKKLFVKKIMKLPYEEAVKVIKECSASVKGLEDIERTFSDTELYLEHQVDSVHGAEYIKFSFDGKFIFYFDSTKHKLIIYDAVKGKVAHSFDSVNQSALGNKTEFYTFTNEEVEVGIYNTKGCESLRVLEDVESEPIDAMAFSLDDKFLVVGKYDSYIEICDVEVGKILFTLETDNEGYIYSINFSPDGSKLIVTYGTNENLEGYKYISEVWNFEKCLLTLDGHTDNILSGVFSPNGKFVVTGSRDSTVKVWDAETGECLKTLDHDGNVVLSVEFNYDKSKLYVHLNSDEMVMYNAADFSKIGVHDTRCVIRSFNFDESRMAAVYKNGKISIKGYSFKHLNNKQLLAMAYILTNVNKLKWPELSGLMSLLDSKEQEFLFYMKK